MAQAQTDLSLQILVTGTDGKATLTDKTGKVHVLPPLDVSDVLELEKRMGGTMLDENRVLKLSDVMYVLYLSVRKEGCTDDQISRGQFQISERDVYRMFDLSFLNRSMELFADIMKISGLKLDKEEKKEGDPPVPAQASPA